MPMQMNSVPEDSPRDFYKLGGKFLKAARIIFQKDFPNLDFPAFALAGQAIELFLKAYLRTKGQSLGKLRSIGHNLEFAFKTAERHGLTQIFKVEAGDQETLKVLSFVYQSKDFHYKYQGSWELPLPNWTIGFAERLFQAVSRHC